MITTFFILSFIFCSAITTAVILLGYRLVTTYTNQFLKSYFYYLISFYAFAYYGLWAQILVRYGLSRITVDETNLATLANFLPLLGMPFLFVSWIMLYRMSTQLTEHRTKRKKELITHGIIITLGVSLLYVIYMLIPNEYLLLDHEIPVSSLGILFLLEFIYYSIFFFNSRSAVDGNLRKFKLLLIIGILLRIVLFGLTIQFKVILPLTVTLYFLTNLPPLLLLWRQADNHFEPIHSETTESSMIDAISKRYGITKREHEIIEQISLGKTNQQIADELFISLQTVKDHTHRIYKKMGVNSRLKLITLLSK